MRCSRLTIALALLLAALPATAQQAADDPSAVALRYLETVYAFDFDSLGELLTEDAVFRDATAVMIVGAELSYEGRDAIVAGFTAGAEGTRNAGFEVERQFVAGEYVVLTLVYATELSGDVVGAPGDWVPVRVPAVTVLRISGGRVSEHVDYTDYAELQRQIEAFLASR